MKNIGVRELKARASTLLHQVAEHGATYTITRHGQAMGQLTPPGFTPPPPLKPNDAPWIRMFEIAEKIRKSPASKHSAVAELSRTRR